MPKIIQSQSGYGDSCRITIQTDVTPENTVEHWEFSVHPGRIVLNSWGRFTPPEGRSRKFVPLATWNSTDRNRFRGKDHEPKEIPVDILSMVHEGFIDYVSKAKYDVYIVAPREEYHLATIKGRK